YVLTAKGKDLYGVLVKLHDWGEKHVYGDAGSGVTVVHKSCGHDLKLRIACGCCNEMVKPRDIEVTWFENRPTIGEMMPKKEAARRRPRAPRDVIGGGVQVEAAPA